MKFSVVFALGLFTAAAFVSRVQAQQCYDQYKLYDILAQPSGELTINDGFGERKLKVELISENECSTWATDPTGSETGGTGATGLTTVSLDAITSYGQQVSSNGDCRINNSSTGGETSHWYPLQGLKVTAPGWRIQPQDLVISDVDMEAGSDPDSSLRKGALVFGFNGNNLVPVRWTFPSSSKLIEHNMKIESQSLSGDLNFVRTAGDHAHLPGIMTTYGNKVPPSPMLRCNKGAREDLCSASASFDEPVEGFFIFHALEWKSLAQGNSLISVANLKLPCGCRCESVSGTRKITLPAVSAGECTQKVASDDHTVCSVDGLGWCERYTFDRYYVNGDVLPNGNYPCVKSDGVAAKYSRTFAP